MKNRTFLSTLGIAITGIAAVGYIAMAQVHGHGEGHGQGGGPGGRGEMMGKGFESLNLTADQKTKIQSLRQQFQQNNASALAEMKTLHEQMKGYAQQKDQANMKATGQQLKAKMEALKPAHEQLHQQILAVLTADQKAQLDKMQADRKAERESKKGQRGQGRQKPSAPQNFN